MSRPAVSLGIAGALACCSLLFAQDPASGQQGAAPAGQAEPDPAVDRSARQMASEWIDSKGWQLGDSEDGSFVVVESAPFNAKSPNAALARSNAFQIAALRAKEKVAAFREKAISAQVNLAAVEGKPPANANGVPADVIEQLAGEIKASGGSAEEMLNSTAFSQAVRTIARSEVCGLVASNMFESADGDGNGSFAVVMRYTPTARALAMAAMGKGNAPTSEALLEAKAWVKQAKLDDLYHCFGTKIFRTEGGELCLVSFGQADVVGKSDSAFSIAAKKAESQADLVLRQFVGELAMGESLLVTTSTVKEYAESGTTYEDESAFLQKINAASRSLSVQGSKILRNWEGKPDGKKAVVGVVQMWSVSSSERAKVLGAAMDEVGGSQGGAGRRDVPPAEQGGNPGRPNPNGERKLPPIRPGNQGPDVPEP